VTRWNPCGAVVDYGRYPFTETIRPFRDSDEEVTIRWYPAREDAPVLPFPSCIYNRSWDLDQVEAGGQPLYLGPAPPYNRAKVNPLALGNHQCGTARDFAEGGEYLPDLPPVEYRADGLPVCCGAMFEGIGGADALGAADVTYQPPPGADCSTAAVFAVGVPYTFITDGRVSGEYWWTFTAPSTGLWRFSGTGVAATVMSAFAGVCPGGPFFLLIWTGFTADCVSLPLNAGDQIWVVANVVDTGTTLTITPNSGAC
jgi:hypothetical protein